VCYNLFLYHIHRTDRNELDRSSWAGLCLGIKLKFDLLPFHHIRFNDGDCYSELLRNLW